jgi:predicted DNA-binding protein (UPF0251 family)
VRNSHLPEDDAFVRFRPWRDNDGRRAICARPVEGLATPWQPAAYWMIEGNYTLLEAVPTNRTRGDFVLEIPSTAAQVILYCVDDALPPPAVCHGPLPSELDLRALARPRTVSLVPWSAPPIQLGRDLLPVEPDWDQVDRSWQRRWEIAFRHTYQAAVNYFISRGVPYHDARELVSSQFVKSIEYSQANPRFIGYERSLVLSQLYWRWVDYIRHRHRHPERIVDSLPEPTLRQAWSCPTTPVEQVMSEMLMGDLEAILTAFEFNVVRLHDLEDEPLTDTQIAVRLGIPRRRVGDIRRQAYAKIWRRYFQERPGT